MAISRSPKKSRVSKILAKEREAQVERANAERKANADAIGIHAPLKTILKADPELRAFFRFVSSEDLRVKACTKLTSSLAGNYPLA